MKRIIVSLLLLLLIPVISVAQVELTGLSYDELVDLSRQVGSAIMSHELFDSVSVPSGLWEVGVDIPQGTWILTPANGDYVSVVYGKSIDSSENAMDMFDDGNTYESMSDDDSWRIIAKDGCYFYISGGSVIFTSDTGSSGLGFKKRN